MNGVKVTCEQPGFQAHKCADRQKTLNPRGARIIPRLACRFEVPHEQTELNAQEEAPSEEKPLDRQPPVTRFFPVDYFIHDALKIPRIEYQRNDFGQISKAGTLPLKCPLEVSRLNL